MKKFIKTKLRDNLKEFSPVYDKTGEVIDGTYEDNNGNEVTNNTTPWAQETPIERLRNNLNSVLGVIDSYQNGDDEDLIETIGKFKPEEVIYHIKKIGHPYSDNESLITMLNLIFKIKRGLEPVQSLKNINLDDIYSLF